MVHLGSQGELPHPPRCPSYRLGLSSLQQGHSSCVSAQGLVLRCPHSVLLCMDNYNQEGKSWQPTIRHRFSVISLAIANTSFGLWTAPWKDQTASASLPISRQRPGSRTEELEGREGSSCSGVSQRLALGREKHGCKPNHEAVTHSDVGAEWQPQRNPDSLSLPPAS